MARLPTPGSDEGSWGEILNNYLTQSHNSDGTLKDDSVTSAALAPGAVNNGAITSGSVTNSKLADGAVTPNKLNSGTPVAGEVLSYDGSGFEWITGGAGEINTAGNVGTEGVGVFKQKQGVNLQFKNVAPGSNKITITDNGLTDSVEVDVDTSNLGLTKSDVGLANVDNTSDADKPVSTATQTALDGKTDTGHAHSEYLPVKNGTSDLTDSTSDRFAQVDITNDGSPTGSWPDRFAFYYAGTRSGYFNEYGELRARPARSNTVALRAMKWSSSSTVNVFEVSTSTPPSSGGTLYFGVGPDEMSASVPLNSTADITTTGAISASNIGNKVTTSLTAPSDPAVGDVWVDTSS